MGDIMAKAKWGERMIRVSIRFWTDALPEEADERSSWDYGMISLDTNKSRAIKADKIFFDSRKELLPKMKELLKRNKITLYEKKGYQIVEDW